MRDDGDKGGCSLPGTWSIAGVAGMNGRRVAGGRMAGRSALRMAVVATMVATAACTLTGCATLLFGGHGYSERSSEEKEQTDHVVVTSSPAGAHVLDGAADLGVTPADVGLNHTVKVTRTEEVCHPGYALATDVALGLLVAAAGGAAIATAPPPSGTENQSGQDILGDAAVVLGGLEAGIAVSLWLEDGPYPECKASPVAKEERMNVPRTHRLSIERDGYAPSSLSITVPAEAAAQPDYYVQLTPTDAAMLHALAANPGASEAPLTARPVPSAHPHDFVIAVGISKYRSGLPEATGAEDDAKEFSELANKVLGVPPENVILLQGEHATRSDILSYLEDWLPQNAKPDSTIYFYFAGHGAPDVKTGDAYLVPWEADPRFIGRQGIPVEELKKDLEALKAKESLVLLDSCFSGAGGRSVLPEGTRPLVPVKALTAPASSPMEVGVLSATAPSEVSGLTGDGRHGLFSAYIVKGLLGYADLNHDGTIAVKELADYVRDHVSADAARQSRQQTPQFTTNSASLATQTLVRLQ